MHVCSRRMHWRAQCDAWRPLRLPAVLVGDGRLGGISTTLAAADSLLLRGYDLAAVAVRVRCPSCGIAKLSDIFPNPVILQARDYGRCSPLRL